MTPTRERMIEAAIDGLQRRGVEGTSFTEILEASGAARGAIYHHFPGGKAELLAEATTTNAAQVRGALEALGGDTPGEVIEAFLALVRPVVERSAAGGGCAVAAATVGPDTTDPALRDAARAAFNSWADAIAERLTGTGLLRARALDLATTLLIVLEGAHILSRAAGSVEPFDRAARTVAALAAALPSTR